MYNWLTFLKNTNTKIYCICLQNRDDKYNIVYNEFKKINILDHVTFYRPKKNNNPGLGCFLSHKHCINDSLKHKKNAIVFEDDVKFVEDWVKKIEYVYDFLTKCNNWDTFRLGCFLTSIYKDENNTKNISLSKSFMTHAIIYNLEFIKNNDLNELEQIDDYLHNNINIREYALINPMCFQQIINHSDNIWNSTYIQNIFQNKYIYENLQKYNNKYVYIISCMSPTTQEKINIWNIMYKIL